MDASALQLLIPIAGIVAILFAIYLARDVLSRDTGTEAMQEVAGTIFEGAVAFIRRQYTTIFVLAIVGAVIIGVVITLVETPEVADVPKLAGVPIGLMTAFAFFVGALCSMASGIIGMFVAVRANVRTASAARRSLVEAVQVAMRGGLALLDRLSVGRFGKNVVAATDAQRRQLLDDIAYTDGGGARASAERQAIAFFTSFRDLTATGFFTSKMGMADLQYQGNVFVSEWTGCPDAALKKLGVS